MKKLIMLCIYITACICVYVCIYYTHTHIYNFILITFHYVGYVDIIYVDKLWFLTKNY